MKINQLFIKYVETDLIIRLLESFGLNGFEDKRLFCRYDLEQINVMERSAPIIEELRSYYLPCKAKVYLNNLNTKKLITVLKQVIRLNGYCLKSKERNFKNKKIMFYTLISEEEINKIIKPQFKSVKCVIDFN